jgi:hypothetical protein
MNLKLIPKPEGFELRDRRSSKQGDASVWRPTDALYDAQQAMVNAPEPVTAVVVVWREQGEDGRWRPRSRISGEQGSAPQLMLAALGDIMGWTK